MYGYDGDAAGPDWARQQENERERWELEQAQGTLREEVRRVIEDGAGFADLQGAELHQMTALAIRAAFPAQAWKFIQEAPGSENYPGLVAEALAGEYGGFLGLERTRERLVRAILQGAVRYAQDIIEPIFEQECARRAR